MLRLLETPAMTPEEPAKSQQIEVDQTIWLQTSEDLLIRARALARSTREKLRTLLGSCASNGQQQQVQNES